MSVDERKRAEALYQKLLGVFPKKRADNVVIFPARARQGRNSPQAALAPLEGRAQTFPENPPADRASRIEGLLRRLFEDLAKDD